MKGPQIIKFNSGVYLLEMKIPKSFGIAAKKFTGETFPSGYYYYAGSAQKNLQHRIVRHLKKEKIINWHIDHLTVLPFAEITKVFILPEAPKSAECNLVKTLQVDFGLSVNKKGFGNGDCQICETHLLYSDRPIDQSHFISLYQSTVCLIPSSIDIS